MRGDGGRADIDRETEHRLVQPGPHADDLLLPVYRDRHLPRSRPQRPLQNLQHGQIAGEILEVPFPLERLEQAAKIAGRIVHVGLFDLHVMQADHRIQLDGARIGLLAHHLPMHLTARGHVDHDIGEHPRRARQTPSCGERRTLREPLLGLAELGQARRRGRHAELGELALGHQDLAAAAERTAAAHRVDVHAEAARSLQQGRAHGKIAALAGRHEHDERIAGSHARRRR